MIPPSPFSPTEPARIYHKLRHAWALRRKQVPEVVCIDGVAIPKPRHSRSASARYCSLFFRPWCLNAGSREVPHVALLGLRAEQVQAFYTTNIDAAHRDVQHDFPAAWREYLCSGVVSANAAKVIRSFLVHTIAPGERDGDNGDEQSNEDAAPKPDEDAPKVTLNGRVLESLLQGQYEH